MRVLVCGGRDFTDFEFFLRWMNGWFEDKYDGLVIIHGGARGVDSFAGSWAAANDVPVEDYPAEWTKHGNAAGPIRNQQMLDDGKPDLVIAFPGGKGTADMIRRAKKAGIPVEEVIPSEAI